MSEAQNGGNVMERLTYRDKDGFPMMKKRGGFKQGGVERLAAYEDTRLEPEEVSSLVKDWSDLCTIVGECGGLDRVKALAEADKDGRVAVLPCKAGDTVYEVTSRKTISEYRVKAIRVELFCTFVEWDIVAGFVDKSIFGVPVDEIGKTVFLTIEEAKAALEAMKDGNG